MNLDNNDRSWQKPETIYVTDDGVFFTYDGEGRVWYDSLAEAQADTGLDKVVHL